MTHASHSQAAENIHLLPLQVKSAALTEIAHMCPFVCFPTRLDPISVAPFTMRRISRPFRPPWFKAGNNLLSFLQRFSFSPFTALNNYRRHRHHDIVNFC